VRSNLKIGTERLVHTGPKTQSPWRGPRMPRCMFGSRNTQRQTQRRDGDCGLGRYLASSFGPTSSLRQIRGVLGDSRRYRLHQTPNAKRCTFLSLPTSVRLFDALITDYRSDYRLLARPPRPVTLLQMYIEFDLPGLQSISESPALFRISTPID
jgi:hypothetical protein